MLLIPDHSILIVPSALHLPFYKEIFSQKQNCLDIELFSLDTFIDSFLLKKEKEPIEILFEYKQALQDISEKNAFYSSRNDVDFLNTILSFVRMKKLFSIESLPKSTKKEKDIYEILEKVMNIPLKEDETIQQDQIPFDQIYILKKEYSPEQAFWIDFLIQNKAHWLESNQTQTKKYWSCANARKEMEIVANEILNKEYKAEDVFIALENNADRYVLSQILKAHQIPYTFLSSDVVSLIPDQWIACLKYVHRPCLDTYLDVVKTLYPKSGQCVLEYHELFKDIHLNGMEYEENALISEETFQTYQQLEQECLRWEYAHAFIQDWKLDHLETLGQSIQNITPNPSEEDMAAFDGIVQAIAYAKPYLKTEDDITFFIQYLEHTKPKTSLNSIQGVLIGKRSDLSALRPIAFYIGAHAKVFPGLRIQNGLFNEAYLAKTTFTPLQERLQNQRKQIFTGLSQPEILYVLLPQSDYQGKSYEASYDMNDWMQTKPKFIPLKDPSFIVPPTFEVPSDHAKELFFKDNTYRSSYSRIHTFQDCPLKHYLRYGLSLQPNYEKDPLQIKKAFLEKILQKAKLLKTKSYQELSYEDVKHLIEEEMQFAQKIFVQKQAWFEEQTQEYAFRIHALLEQLNVLETKMHLKLLNSEYQIQENKSFHDVQVEMKGSLQAYDAFAADYLVFDDASDPTHPVGSFQLSLKPTCKEHTALNVSYRTTQPEYKENLETTLNTQMLEESIVRGWKLQDLPDGVSNPLLKTIQKKVPTMRTCQEKLSQSLDTMLEGIEAGQIAPSHSNAACIYCPYKAICRNSAKGRDA